MWILARQFESIILKYTCGSSRKCAPKDTHSKWKGRFPSSIRGKQKPIFTYCIMCVAHGKLDPVAIGTSGWPLHSLFGSKRAILGHRCQKTACRAAERARNGKPKVSRVTSEHGEVMIPSSWVRLRPKNGLYGRSVEKGWFIVNFIKIGNF